MQHFEHAKNLDSNYALAYIGISETWLMRAISSYTTAGEAKPKAIAACEKAYKLDSTLAEVHVCRSRIQSYLMYNIRDAELSCRKALEINPCLLYTSPSPRDRTRSRMPS